jgi:hypothetical protein
MWCSNCQQDTPAISRGDSTKLACSRCHTTLRPPHAVGISEAGIALDDDVALELVDSRPPLAADDWQLRRRTRELGRRLQHSVHGVERRVDASQKSFPPQTSFADIAERTATPIVDPLSYHRTTQPAPPPGPEFAQIFAWLVTLVGFTSLAVGLGTMAWIIAHGGSEFWSHALALTLAGQGALIFGLILVVARLWRHSRHASGKLQEVHAELAQVHRATEALSGLRTAGAPAFYAELVRGASPQMLLTNLKGQIDQLATRLNAPY